ncbi:MAG TPA: FkbM family methyltransferase [Flavipsychrobacter sp.]|nr:FkbM family methyltransferase [Flavipsychrobacter sp.]
MNVLKKLLPDSFKRNIKEQLGVPSMRWSLQNLKKLGFSPKAALDIGAYKGEWTNEFLVVFPDTEVLMIEAQTSKAEGLRQLCDKNRNVRCHIGLLGAKEGDEVVFSEDETASFVDRDKTTNGKIRKTETVDSILKKHGFPTPDFLKLDVQGYELDVLTGSEDALSHVSFCLLEVALLDYGKGNPLLLDVISFMDSRGFQAYDILQLMRRPYDKALDQMDMLFIRKDSILIKEKRWS